MTTKKNKAMKIIPPGKKKCVWMEAGVVSYKLCDNNFDCSTCVYDQAMEVKAARSREAAANVPVAALPDKFSINWAEKMMTLPASMRKCRYMLTGEVGRKLCPNAYECGNCSFDQMMQDRLLTEPLPVSISSEKAGFEMAEGFYYHEGHTWARPEYGGRVRIGLDDFAQKLLGDLSSIELPNIGQAVKQGEAGFQLRKNKQLAKALSPIDGVVVHINEQVGDSLQLINESPYEKGWLFIIEPTKLRKNLKDLYFADKARKYMSDDQDRLFAMANDDMRIAADGGESMEDIFGAIGEKKWIKLVKTFFKT